MILVQAQHDQQTEKVEGAELDAEDGQQSGAEPDDCLVQP